MTIKGSGINGFSLKLVQFKRTSDYVLVYCPGFFDRNTFLLIAIIKHWSHKKPDEIARTDRDTSLMDELEKITEDFRAKY